MRKTNSSALIILTSMIIYYILCGIVIIPKFRNNFYIINFIFWLVLAIASIILYRPKINKKRINGDTNQIITIYLILYFIIFYSLGLITGFLKNSYALTFLNITKNLITNSILIISFELIRYGLIKNIKPKKTNYAIFVIIFTIGEILFKICTSNYSSNYAIFEVILVSFLPVLAKNIMLSYITYNVGFTSAILYRLLMELYVYVIPISPGLDKYVQAIVYFIFPFIILFSVQNLVNKYKQEYTIVRHNASNYLYIFTMIFALIIVSLTLGIFRYKLIAVKSNSMYPVFARGYGIIYKKIDSSYIDNIKENDILVYKLQNTFIIHRVVDIDKENKRVHTKGDNNEVSDTFPVYSDQFIGIVKLELPLVGYPSILIQEYMEK